MYREQYAAQAGSAADLYEIPIKSPGHPSRKPTPGVSGNSGSEGSHLLLVRGIGPVNEGDDCTSSLQGASDVGPYHAGHWARLLRAVGRLHDRLRSALTG